MKLHDNSLRAYYEGKLELFPRRSANVLRALSLLGMATDREVCGHLGFSDMNTVRPRITELVKAGVLEQVGDQIDPVTERDRKSTRLNSSH